MKIRMKPKGSNSNWVEYEDVKFLIDYLTSEQAEQMQMLALGMVAIEDETEKRIKLFEIAKLYLRSVIRGWEIHDEDNNEIPFISKNGLVERELFYDVIGYEFERVFALYNDFTEKLSITEIDKKK